VAATANIQAGHAIIGIVNITDEEVEMEEPVLRVTEVDPGHIVRTAGRR